MGRTLRPYSPGGVFHITARTQGKAMWFVPGVVERISSYCATTFHGSDAQLFAFAIMTNHLHLVVRQGAKPLSRLMQPLLRRIAIAVQNEHHVEGHVFGARYSTSHCSNAQWVRNAIIYTHLNPWKEKMCDDSVHYRWSSHTAYARDWDPPPEHPSIAFEEGLRLFRQTDDESLATTRLNYLAAVRERMQVIQFGEAGHGLPITYAAGDADWDARFQAPYQAPARSSFAAQRPRDLRDIAIETALEEMPEVDLNILRSRWGGRHYANVRATITARLHLLGFANREIAEFLDLSNSRISHILADIENRAGRQHG